MIESEDLIEVDPSKKQKKNCCNHYASDLRTQALLLLKEMGLVKESLNYSSFEPTRLV